MGEDEPALLRLWREKLLRGWAGRPSGNLVVQLGAVTEDLNRLWYQANTGEVVTDVQRHVKHPALGWMAATLDGRVVSSGAVFEAKFMLPWSFSEGRPQKSTCRNYSTICGSLLPAARFCQ